VYDALNFYLLVDSQVRLLEEHKHWDVEKGFAFNGKGTRP